MKKLELKSNMMGNEKEVNYDNLKNPLFYDFDVKGLNQDFDPNNFQNFCAEKG